MSMRFDYPPSACIYTARAKEKSTNPAARMKARFLQGLGERHRRASEPTTRIVPGTPLARLA
ncbi:hypothetical protein GNZ24_21425 [Burkholderia thailandensis]|uniref:hypothetical protein n=1 Tax=Burkholderia thailandensis TaxID=57975 RepID=UPI0004B6572F|nr:hypothetical protein [Burkholderia thailandensis]MUV29520.1 hypothetical protein [Burkholderia thailandensis]QRA14201.1 hypothetical protein JMY07_19280 [Burkholderia thailandensis]